MNSFYKWIFFFIGMIIIITVVIVKPYYLFVTKTLKVSPFQVLLSLDGLKSYNNQVNFLLLGIAGGDHDGPELSDSIMAANYNLGTNQLTTISIPRDIWSDTLQNKINSAFAYGGYAKNKSVFNPKDGLTLAKAEISAIVGMPVQYAGVIDFNQFEAGINFLGGIDVKVETTFDDYAFPIPDEQIKDSSCGHFDAEIKTFTDSFPTDQEIWKYFPCRYKHVHFDKGTVHMDGTAALIFVRSRHATGQEGTDFAREQRQQKVIEAVKNKLIDLAKAPDIKKYEELYKIFNQLIKRDISNQQMAIIIRKILFNKKLVQQKITLTEDLFINPDISERYNNLWVLIPKYGSFSIIHQYIKCYLDNKIDCGKLKNKG